MAARPPNVLQRNVRRTHRYFTARYWCWPRGCSRSCLALCVLNKEFSDMASRAQLLTGIGVGFGLMYLLDPERGARRRARLRDAAVNAAHTAADAADAAGRDLSNRIAGTAAEVRGRFTDGDVDDQTLIERVRTKLGRVVSHPHAISVTSDDGVITMTGPVLQAEVSS